eukprot:1160791-Pelagomonas_calceolata.AAC.3
MHEGSDSTRESGMLNPIAASVRDMGGAGTCKKNICHKKMPHHTTHASAYAFFKCTIVEAHANLKWDMLTLNFVNFRI